MITNADISKVFRQIAYSVIWIKILLIVHIISTKPVRITEDASFIIFLLV